MGRLIHNVLSLSAGIIDMRVLIGFIAFITMVFNGCGGGGGGGGGGGVSGTLLTAYASPAGNDGNSGSISQPFKTIQRCASSLMAGGTCFVREGTYLETIIPNSGTTIRG
jgi:hypothetical protein